MYEKLTKCPNLHGIGPKNYHKVTTQFPTFYYICSKIHKITEFYMIFARKMPELYVIIGRKIFFPNCREHVAQCLPFPKLMICSF